jgi:hypothetical protein
MAPARPVQRVRRVRRSRVPRPSVRLDCLRWSRRVRLSQSAQSLKKMLMARPVSQRRSPRLSTGA